jgi:diadenosine tetraphosphate (Ap4A) HIT family hydrolase
MSCPFCDIPIERILTSGKLLSVIKDAFPVTPGHTLIVPKRHFASYSNMTFEEMKMCFLYMDLEMAVLKKEDRTIEGFNIGINVGEVAGQTVMHCHIHLIPRRKGDVEKPRGGVRNLIPGKGDY